jgi:hypothetical protein
MPDYRTVGHPKAEELLRILAHSPPSTETHDPTVVPDIQQ